MLTDAPADKADVDPTTTSARLEGRSVLLRALGAGDYDALRAIELSPDLIQRWRQRGRTPGPGDWVQTLEAGVLCQFLVVEPVAGRERWIGLVTAYGANFEHGYAYVAMTKFDQEDRTLKLFEGVFLFVEYLFTTWPLRKLYAESTAFNYTQFESGAARFFDVEGRLRSHSFYDGRYWDQLIVAVHRDRWAARRDALARLFARDRTDA